MANRTEPLPAPRVRLGEDFPARLGALRRRLVRARGLRGFRPGAAPGAGWARGSEFEGYRPYRPGDDLRELDWTLLARWSEPQIRLKRPEGGEHWAIAVDTSASMGLGGEAGEHGKLQRAAEIALGLAALAAAEGAEVRLVAAPAGAARLRRTADLGRALRWAEGLEAGGAGLRELLAGPVRLAGLDRLFLVGDLFDLRPADATARARPGLALGVARVLAPEELAPPPRGRVAWLDPETGERRAVDLARAAGAYQRALHADLRAWERVAGRARLRLAVTSSAAPFERAVLQLLRPGA